MMLYNSQYSTDRMDFIFVLVTGKMFTAVNVPDLVEPNGIIGYRMMLHEGTSSSKIINCHSLQLLQLT